MPCQYNCDVNRLNFQLKDIKIDKIKTLREIYEVTDQLGRDHPHRRDEMTRSKIEIDEKLMTAVAELLCIEDEISRGCTTCRENWNPQTKLSIRWQKSRTPHPRCHLPTTCGRSLWPAYRSEENDTTKKWRCRAAGHVAVGQSLGVSSRTCSSVDDITSSPC